MKNRNKYLVVWAVICLLVVIIGIALPVTRKELYFTNVLSGFTFLFIPQLITFMVTVVVCLANGIR